MGLSLVIGGSGSGKSTWVYRKIIEESMAHPDRQYIVIVPEQFTLQTQRDLVMMHPLRGILNIDVLSFKRLALRVFEETGTDPGEVLTETGKTLIVRRIAGEVRQDLKLMGKAIDRSGYVAGIKSMLSEFEQYEIDDAALEEMIVHARGNEMLQAKLEDLRILRRSALAYRAGRYSTGEELLTVLSRVLPESRLARESTFVFDSFTGFTPVQESVLFQLLKISPEILVTVCADPDGNLFESIKEYELFALSKRTIQSLARLASDAGTEIRPPVLLTGENGRFGENASLRLLEKNLFRYRNTGSRETVQSRILLKSLANPAAEVREAAAQIKRLIREQKCKYREIAVIAGNLPSYREHVSRIFREAGIPCFIDQTMPLGRNMAISFVRSLLRVGEGRFDYLSVMGLLRSGCLPYDRAGIDVLENYILARGLRFRRSWQQEWTEPREGFTAEEVERCNRLRADLMEILEPLLDRFSRKDACVSDYVQGLYDAMCTFGLEETLAKQAEEAQQHAGADSAMEYRQVYGVILTLLEEINTLIGSDRISVKEFASILEAGIAESKVGIVPPVLETVHVGDMERTRLAHVKYLFLLGMNDGWIPARTLSGGVLGELERAFLKDEGFYLAPGERENSFTQRFYLYLILTKAREGLFLSYARSDAQGKAMRPSYLISALKGIDGLQVITQEQEEAEERLPDTQVQALEYFAMLLPRSGEKKIPSGPAEEMYAFLRKQEGIGNLAEEMWKRAFGKPKDVSLSEQAAVRLFAGLDGSVTRLEQFARCPFGHFARYGLDLKERDKFEVRMADAGTVLHEVLHLYARCLQEEKISWKEISESRQRELVSRLMREVTERYGDGRFTDSARMKGMRARLEGICLRAVKTMTAQLAGSSFEPAAFEVSFRNAGELEQTRLRLKSGKELQVQGRIDRIDLCEQDQTVYVKIIDYKSGKPVFDLGDVYHGLSLQLALYLSAALELEGKIRPDRIIVPAGFLYERLQDPIVEEEDLSMAEQQILMEMRPDGLVNQDDAVLALLDENTEFPGKSWRIPVGRTVKGELEKASKCASEEQLRMLGKYARLKMEQGQNAVLEGTIVPSPAKWSNRTACDYCRYRDVCGFDEKLPGFAYRRLRKVDRNAFWYLVNQALEKGDRDGTGMDE